MRREEEWEVKKKREVYFKEESKCGPALMRKCQVVVLKSRMTCSIRRLNCKILVKTAV